MSKNLKKFISLIPTENDDKFFGEYHRYRRNSSPKNKLNVLIKKPLNLEIDNFTPESYQLNYTLEKYGKRQNFLPKIQKINLKLNQGQISQNLITNISTSHNSYIYHKPIEDEKSKIRPKINRISRKLTINNIIFNEDISTKNHLSISPSKHNIIYLERKKNLNDLDKNIINKEYEKEMNQFKIYSKNMNEMIANQMVLEFFRKKKELQKLNSDDLALNYIKSNDNINTYDYNYYNRRISTAVNNNESDEIINENNSNNLIIHNVFFEWIISNTVQRYLNEIYPINRNDSIKFVRNLLINEVRTLSKLFFYRNKKKDDSDLPRNMRIVRNIFKKYKINRPNHSEKKIKKDDVDLKLDIKQEEIRQKLLEKIMEKIVETDKQKINNQLNNIKSNKSVDILNIQNNKQLNETSNKIGNERENNTTLEEENNNNINNTENQRNIIVQKVSVETNTDSSLNTNYKKIDVKTNNTRYNNCNETNINNDDDDYVESYGLYEPYYRHDIYDDHQKYKKEYRRNRNRQSIKEYIKSNKTESYDNNTKSQIVNNSKNSSPTPFKNQYRRLQPINYKQYNNKNYVKNYNNDNNKNNGNSINNNKNNSNSINNKNNNTINNKNNNTINNKNNDTINNKNNNSINNKNNNSINKNTINSICKNTSNSIYKNTSNSIYKNTSNSINKNISMYLQKY